MKSKNQQSGFTLVEMIVAVSIFVIVAMIVSLVFVSLAKANRKAQDLKVLIDNVNFSMDAMVLDLKFGHDYRCDPVGASPCTKIWFTDIEDDSDHYYSWEIENGIGRIKKDGANLTAEGVNITATDFSIFEFSTANPMIRLFVVGEVTTRNGVSTKFNLQTVISERNL